jgi:YidC/Oxa1 family membrane protein insertase
MKFDRNTVIGFILLALLFFGLFYFNSQEQARMAKNNEIERKKKAVQDSIARTNQTQPKSDTANRAQQMMLSKLDLLIKAAR